MNGTPAPAGPGAPPRLIPAAPEQSWLELFYDLVFVAAIVVMSTTYSNYAGLDGVIWLALVFSMIWFTWLTTTLLLGTGLVTTTWTRTLLVTQMVLVLTVAIASDYSHEDNSRAVGPLFAAVLVTLALFFRAARRACPTSTSPTAATGCGACCRLPCSWRRPRSAGRGGTRCCGSQGLLLFVAPTRSEQRRLPWDGLASHRPPLRRVHHHHARRGVR